MAFLPRLAAAGGCGLSLVVGYQLVKQKVIEACIAGGKSHPDFEGCQPDRVLVLTDRVGVRCKKQMVRHLDEPVLKAYLFARSAVDIKKRA